MDPGINGRLRDRTRSEVLSQSGEKCPSFLSLLLDKEVLAEVPERRQGLR